LLRFFAQNISLPLILQVETDIVMAISNIVMTGGALGVTVPILESIPYLPGDAGWSWVGCGCHNVPIYRPNSNSAEFHAWVVFNYSSYVVLG